jgi:superfamily II DNA or RNA helicase
MITLREDQEAAIERLRSSIRAGKRRVMLQAATGFGKTVLAGMVVRAALDKGGRVLFTVPAIQLIDQTVASLEVQGIDNVGVIQATHERTNWDMPVQVASVQTLMKRTIPDASVVIIDEAHRWFSFYGKWFLDPKWQAVPFIGLSATPWTKGLGSYYEELIIAGTTEQCIAAGTLSPFKVFAPSHPDLSDVATTAGDYQKDQLSTAMSREVLVADIVKTWLKLGENRPTLCFAVDCAHAQLLQRRFQAAGVTCAYQDARTKADERALIKARFHSGDYKIVCNVGTLTTGVDWDVRCLILARPTRSEMLFVQMVGRALRTAPGKDHALILDHSDNHLRLGFVTDIHHETLHDGKTPLTTAAAGGIKLPKECPQCAFLKAPGLAVCPNCGHVTERAVGKVGEREGELRELKARAKPPKGSVEATLREMGRSAIYAGLLWVVHERGYKPGWADNKFRELFGVWPRVEKGTKPEPPCAPLRSWLKSRQIAWAKGQALAEKPKLTELIAREYAKAGQPIPQSLASARVPGTLCTEEDLLVDW